MPETDRTSPRESKNPERATRAEGWFVYMVKCTGGRIYTGITQDVPRRFAEHQTGGCCFTKAYPARRLLYAEPHPNRANAERRERQLKGWTRAKKLALAAGDLDRLKRL